MALIMLYAPIGLGAYFAYLIGSLGPQLFSAYFRSLILYYPVAIGHCIIGFSLYAYLAGGLAAVKKFWVNIIPATVTAWATGSSIATIPVNLRAAERIGTPRDIREMTIPIGATIHMDGSCLAAILKIAFLFSMFGMSFSGPQVIFSAIGVAIVSGVVISGIPSGGMLGELMIVTLYGFPIEALPIITMIGTLVDPPATMVNATGDNVVSMMIARILNGKKWMETSA
jgi:Na+/H+-dicarboxylate symporter